MSTIFAVKIPCADKFYTMICTRSSYKIGIPRIRIGSHLFYKLPNNILVFPLDNTSQGVETIYDLRVLYIKYIESLINGPANDCIGELHTSYINHIKEELKTMNKLITNDHSICR